MIGLCVLFGGGLVGHGIPFWAASTTFVTVASAILRQGERRRSVATALAIGLAAGGTITLVFQHLFLVRLP